MEPKTPEPLSIIFATFFRLAPAAGYSILLSILTLVILWLNEVLKFDVLDTGAKHALFWASTLLVVIPLGLLVFHRLFVFIKICFLRHKYNRKRLNKTFFCIHFLDGRVFIFDTVDKSMRWIKTWQTAEDLGLENEWTVVEVDPKNYNSLIQHTQITTKDGITLRLAEYTLGKPVFTQNSP